MKIVITAIALIFAITTCASAEEDNLGRYKLYSAKNGANRLLH